MTVACVCCDSKEIEKREYLLSREEWSTHNEKESAILVHNGKSIFGLRLYSNRIISIVHSSSFIFMKESYQKTMMICDRFWAVIGRRVA